MATAAQIEANRANAQHSTGPTSPEAKQNLVMHAYQHGLAGSAFVVLPDEDQKAYETLYNDLREEHNPRTITERMLVDAMAQHHWLTQRALRLQEALFAEENFEEKRLALFIRYQTTHERAFHRALNTLLMLRAEKRKAEIGFESQKLKEAAEGRRQSLEQRKQDLHQAELTLAELKNDHQRLLNLQIGYAIEKEERLRIAA